MKNLEKQIKVDEKIKFWCERRNRAKNRIC